MSEANPASHEEQRSTPAADTTPGGRPDDVAVFPNLVYKEFLAALLISIVLLAWSLAIDAPLRPEADPGRTENPAKAPWYFVGLQELLVYFDPWIAGVGLPTLIIVGLMLIPYLDTTRHLNGQYTFRYRRLAVWNYLFGFGLWWVLIAVGQVLRGPNWQFYWPWESWAIAKASEESLWNFPLWVGLPLLAVYFAAGLVIPRVLWPWLHKGLGATRCTIVMIFTLIMYSVPIKIILRLFLGVKYVLITPWFNI
jgi:hypothetical protein